jgi:hypothetical protein
VPSSVFLDFVLPNPTAWSCFAFFLAVTIFFQFARPFAWRNWDLLALFLFVPGFLLLQEANRLPLPEAGDTADNFRGRVNRLRFVGYAWLLSASLYWFVRCLIDLAARRRPVVLPNLTTPGLAWFGGSLFVCLMGVAFARPLSPWEPVGKRPAAVTGVEAGATAVVAQAQPEVSERDARFWVERSLAAVGHLGIVTGLVLIGWRQFTDLATGFSAGVLYLLIPYTGFHIGQVHHVLPAALIVWAVYLYRSPFFTGGLLGLAAGVSFFPLLLAPVWVQFYRGRGQGRFMAGLLAAGLIGLTLTLTVIVSTTTSTDGFWRTLSQSDWQPWRTPTAESIWTGAHWAYRLPVFVVYAGFLITVLFWPRVRDLGQLIAASAAVLIGVQFWYADRGGLYVLWYAPLLVLLVLRPAVSDLQPLDLAPLPRWVTAIGHWLGRRVGWRPVDVRDLPTPSTLTPRPGDMAPRPGSWYSPAVGSRS